MMKRRSMLTSLVAAIAAPFVGWKASRAAEPGTNLFDIGVNADLRKGRHFIGLLYLDGELYAASITMTDVETPEAEAAMQRVVDGGKRVLRGEFGDE